MGGIHDLGGVDGFGPVDLRTPDVQFLEEWQRIVFGATMAFMVAGLTTEAEMRHALERLRAEDYIGQSYWERWVSGLETLLIEKGLTTKGELSQLAGTLPVLGRPGDGHAIRPRSDVEDFDPGTRVRVREWHPRGHTRCPNYVQGRVGTVVRRHGVFPFPDGAERAGAEPVNEAVYCVCFESAELWGEGGGAREKVHVDLWQTYLERSP